MSNETNNPMLITYGDYKLDFAALPQTSLVAMLRRGVSHYLGSEQASKVTGYFDPDREDENKMDDTPENRAKVKAEYVAKAIDALLAGTVGVSVRGPTVDPITVIVRRLARAEVINILKANGVKPPKKATDIIKTSGGDFTLEQFIDRRLDPTIPSGMDKKSGVSHHDRLTRDAKKIAAEQAKKAEKAAEAAKEAGIEAL